MKLKVDLIVLSSTATETPNRVKVVAKAESASQFDVQIQVDYEAPNVLPARAIKDSTVHKPTSLTIVPGTSSTTAEAACTISTPSGSVPGCGVTRTFKYQVRDKFGDPMAVGGMPFWDSINAGSPNSCNLVGFRTTCSPPNTGPCGKSTDASGQFDETLFICATACRSSSGTCITGCTTSATQIWNINGFDIGKQL